MNEIKLKVGEVQLVWAAKSKKKKWLSKRKKSNIIKYMNKEEWMKTKKRTGKIIETPWPVPDIFKTNRQAILEVKTSVNDIRIRLLQVKSPFLTAI